MLTEEEKTEINVNKEEVAEARDTTNNEEESKKNNEEESKKNNIEESKKDKADKEIKEESNQKPKKKNIVLKILQTIIESIMWIMIIVLSILLVLSVTSKKTDVFGYRMYVIMSGSMEPTIHVKQAIITKEVEEPQLGDIIAFGENEFITVHRVIKVYTEGDNSLYQTKGDNNNTEDKQLIPKSQVKGIVKYRLPVIGEVILFLQSNLIVLFLAIGILVIIIIVRRLI